MRQTKDKFALLRALQLIYRCDCRSFVMKVFYVTLLSLLPLVNLYVLKYMIDGITDMLTQGSATGSLGGMVYYVALFC